MKLPIVNVIMSTYNGEKFVRQQIDSILAQKDVEVVLNIYDDCSKDNTYQILKEYENKFKNVTIHKNEKNKNFAYNFIDALFSFKDDNKYDYYAFADQDDFWLEDKLITAIKQIQDKGECSLYSSNLKLVDENLQPLNRNLRDVNETFKKHDFLRRNFVTGCTCVFDNACKNLFTKQYPENIDYHDYWFALVTVFCANCNYIYDANPEHVLYRQHNSQTSGGAKRNSFLSQLTKKLKIDFNRLRMLLKFYGDCIDEKDKEVIQKFIDYKKLKNKIYLFKNFNCTPKLKFKLNILFNRYVNKT